MEHEDRQNEIERGETERGDRAVVGAARAAGAGGKRGLFTALRTGAAGSALGLGSSALVLAVTTSIAIVALATLGWLSNNREVNSGSQAMEMGGPPFELAVMQTGSARRDPLDFFNSTEYVTENGTRVALDLAGMPCYQITELQTSASTDGVTCALTIDGEEDRLGPGATGTLQFRIRPLRDERQSYFGSVTLNGVMKYLPNENDPTVAALNAEALGFLRSHIAFYTSSDRTQANWIGPDAQGNLWFRVIGVTNTPNSDYTVTLYWEWLKVYGDAKAKTNISDDALLVKGYAGMTAAEQDDVLSLNAGYNEGDQSIGNRIKYIAADVTVQATDETDGLSSYKAIGASVTGS